MIVVKRGETQTIRLEPTQEEERIEILERASAALVIGDSPKITIEAILSGREASLEIIGRFRGNGDARQEVRLRVIERAPRVKCRVNFRAALADSSSSFFDGLIRVEEGAEEAEGFLSYKALLLSPGAKAKPIPRLEVLTKKVASLGHAASVGKIDEEQLFYLQSRGLSRQEAERLIVEGFLNAFYGLDRVSGGGVF